MLDLFCGRGGWTNAFLARGWECVGIDLNPQPEYKGHFIQRDVMELTHHDLQDFDFICASSPCEEFSVHGLRCFFANPKYPDEGIRLFNGTRYLCEASGIPYVMENVRAAQKFVGKAQHRCGPFYLWGNGIPPLMPQGIKKPFRGASGTYMAKKPDGISRKEWRNKWQAEFEKAAGGRKQCAQVAATIPPELANCVADYAERILTMSKESFSGKGPIPSGLTK